MILYGLWYYTFSLDFPILIRRGQCAGFEFSRICRNIVVENFQGQTLVNKTVFFRFENTQLRDRIHNFVYMYISLNISIFFLYFHCIVLHKLLSIINNNSLNTSMSVVLLLVQCCWKLRLHFKNFHVVIFSSGWKSFLILCILCKVNVPPWGGNSR